jgi:hypothetical protein
MTQWLGLGKGTDESIGSFEYKTYIMRLQFAAYVYSLLMVGDEMVDVLWGW